MQPRYTVYTFQCSYATVIGDGRWPLYCHMTLYTPPLHTTGHNQTDHCVTTTGLDLRCGWRPWAVSLSVREVTQYRCIPYPGSSSHHKTFHRHRSNVCSFNITECTTPDPPRHARMDWEQPDLNLSACWLWRLQHILVMGRCRTLSESIPPHWCF